MSGARKDRDKPFMIDPNCLNDPAVAEAFLRESLADTNKEIGEVEAALLKTADAITRSHLIYRLEVLQKDQARLSKAVELADRIERIQAAITSSTPTSVSK